MRTTIGVALFAAAASAIRAEGGWAALGWVLMVIVVLGAIGRIRLRLLDTPTRSVGERLAR